MKSQHSSSEAAPFHIQPLFLIKVVLYVGTGILQPMIIDALRMRGCLGRKALLLPTLAKTAGMAAVGILSTSGERAALLRSIRSDGALRRSILAAAIVDVTSGMMLTGGILLTGGAVFVVLYNSTPAWTALLSRYFLGRPLARKQALGVAVVCAGLMCNIFGTRDQLSHSRGQAARVTMGSAIVLLGCILHAGFFVMSDRALRGHSRMNSKGEEGMNAPAITPSLWSSCLGSMEATAMAIYVLTSSSLKGFQPEGTSPDVCPLLSFTEGFFCMFFVDAVHSAAFYLMLKQIGAVGSALMKGVQSVAVVMLSAVFFCAKEEAQCLTPIKTISVALILAGTFLYAASTPPDHGQVSRRSGNSSENELALIEVETLIDS